MDDHDEDRRQRTMRGRRRGRGRGPTTDDGAVLLCRREQDSHVNGRELDVHDVIEAPCDGLAWPSVLSPSPPCTHLP